jgi:putative ABC transport system permease protein
VSIGALIAVGAGRWIGPLLYKVSPTDPLVYSFVVAVLVLTALAACIIPARRAASVDPNVALRSD